MMWKAQLRKNRKKIAKEVYGADGVDYTKACENK